jgi:hypothetical protein
MGKRTIDGWELTAGLPGRERIAAQPGQLVFMGFDIVESFSLMSADEKLGQYDIELVVKSERRAGGGYRLRLHFTDVSGLTLKVGAGGLVQVMGLTIENISDRQWERQNWQIGQIEDSELSFRAADVRIVAVDPV